MKNKREAFTRTKVDGNDGMKKVLQRRGGSLKIDDSLMYFSVGLINLSERRTIPDFSDEYTIESEEDSTMTSVITQWIERQLSEKDKIKENQKDKPFIIGNMFLLSSEYRSIEFDNLLFHSNHDSDVLEDFGNMAETIGCLSNIIVILYDTSNENRQKAVVRMIKGIERQKKSSDFYKSVDIIILAVDENAEKELNVIRNVLKDGNEDIYQSLQILPVKSDPQIIKDALREAEYAAIVSKASVPVDIFPKLVKSVFSKLGGTSNGDKIIVQGNILKDNRLTFASDVDEDKDSLDDLQETSHEANNDVQELKNQDDDDLPIDNMNIEDNNRMNDEEVDSMNSIMDESLKDEEYKKDSSTIAPEANDSSSNADLPNDDITASNEDSKEAIMTEEENEVTNAESPEELHDVNTETPASIDRTPSADMEDKVSDDLKEYIADKVTSIIEAGETMLADIETRQDDVLLNPDSKMPILEFGRDANNLLLNAKEVFDEQSVRDLIKNDNESIFVDTTKNMVLNRLNNGIIRLYDTQLQSLREYFGRKYEKVIENLDNADEDIEMNEEVFNKRRKQKDAILVDEAKKTTEGFKTAATNAVPILIQNGDMKEFASAYSYENALDGLIRDMMHASASSQSHDAEWASATVDSDGEEEGETSLPNSRRRGPVKWYEKIAARALVFGVNYAQGWLAYQGIKKAAAERDRLQPKFPLF